LCLEGCRQPASPAPMMMTDFDESFSIAFPFGKKEIRNA
jgi:hypothetical protein